MTLLFVGDIGSGGSGITPAGLKVYRSDSLEMLDLHYTLYTLIIPDGWPNYSEMISSSSVFGRNYRFCFFPIREFQWFFLVIMGARQFETLLN